MYLAYISVEGVENAGETALSSSGTATNKMFNKLPEASLLKRHTHITELNVMQII